VNLVPGMGGGWIDSESAADFSAQLLRSWVHLARSIQRTSGRGFGEDFFRPMLRFFSTCENRTGLEPKG